MQGDPLDCKREVDAALCIGKYHHGGGVIQASVIGRVRTKWHIVLGDASRCQRDRITPVSRYRITFRVRP
jgi:uncharacterized Zn-binding protein involved in type VI secretion